MDLIQMIAGNVDSPRKIEGFLVKLSQEIKINRKDLSENLVESLLGKREEETLFKNKKTASDVITAVSKYFSMGKRSLLGSSRARPVAFPRQLLMYILRTQLALPLQEVGRIVGGRDHTTVMHAVEKITHLTSTNVQTREDIRGIKSLL